MRQCTWSWLFVVLCANCCSAVESKLRWGTFEDLVSHPAVLRELAVTDAQQQQLEDIAKPPKLESKQDAESKEAIAKVLSEEQIKRLEEVRLQVLDGFALQDPRLVRELQLSEAQVVALRTAAMAVAQEEREMEDVMKRARFRSSEERNKFIQKYRERANERFMEVLTNAQKERFDALKGKKMSEAVVPR